MRLVSIVLAFAVILSTGCRHPRVAQVGTPNTSKPDVSGIEEDNTKIRLGQKAKIFERIQKIQQQIDSMTIFLENRSAKGFDVSESKDIVKNIINLVAEAKKLSVVAKTSESLNAVLLLFDQIDKSLENADKKAKKAKRFEIIKKSVPKEFGDDRDFVLDKLKYPHPANVQVGPTGSLSFLLTDVTENISGARTYGCYDLGTFTLHSPPKVLIWTFFGEATGRQEIVFIENIPGIDRLTERQDVSPNTRDMALSTICQLQGQGFENYKVIGAYKNQTAGMPEQYLTSLLSGKFRFIDQAGIGNLINVAQAKAPIGDLELVSMAFSTELGRLNRGQLETFNKIGNKIFGQKVGGVRISGGIIDGLEFKEQKKSRELFSKINDWQRTLSPNKKHVKNLLELLQVDESQALETDYYILGEGDKKITLSLDKKGGAVEDKEKLSNLFDNFYEYIKSLSAEFSRIQKDLLRFNRDHRQNELILYDDEEDLTMSFLMSGVGHNLQEDTANTLFRVENPDLLVEVEVYKVFSKYDQPQLEIKNQINIRKSSQFLDSDENFKSLTGFSLLFPFKPDPEKGGIRHLMEGNYIAKFKITDQIRGELIMQEINFVVLPAKIKDSVKPKEGR